MIRRICTYLFLLLAAAAVEAQCNFSYSGTLCEGEPLSFVGVSTGTTHDYNFNGEGSSTGKKDVSYAFKSGGTKTITYVTTINNVKCTSFLQLTLKPKPKIALRLLSNKLQCLNGNKFCFKDSLISSTVSGLSAVRYRLIEDTSIFFEGFSTGNEYCFKIPKNAGDYGIEIYALSADGCDYRDTIKKFISIEAPADFAFTTSITDKCDSVFVKFNNLRTKDTADFVEIHWDWDDGTKSDYYRNWPTKMDWGPTFTKVYTKTGSYSVRLSVKTKNGCIDTSEVVSFTVSGRVTKMFKSDDSICWDDKSISFWTDNQPTGTTVGWDFGDTASGSLNLVSGSWSPVHDYQDLGPFVVTLRTFHPTCGNKVFKDTVMVLGPRTRIENTRKKIKMKPWEIYQCDKFTQDTVHFTNASEFYHNDKKYLNDDSSWFTGPLGKMRHHFTNGYYSTAVKPKNIRGNSNVVRVWDFGDNYALKCTTNSKINYNKNVNCKWSHDSLPWHYYSGWDEVKFRNFGTTPLQENIFIENIKQCKNRLVYPSDSIVVFDDSILVVPNSTSDLATAGNAANSRIKNKHYLREKWVKGPAVRHQESDAKFQLLAGSSAKIRSKTGVFTTVNGPGTFTVLKNEIIYLTNKKDSFSYLLFIMPQRDSIFSNLYSIKLKNKYNYKFISKRKLNLSGTAGKDYVISETIWNGVFESRIMDCYKAELSHKDTANLRKCPSKDYVPISIMNPNAGSYGLNLLKGGIECYGNANPQYGLTFILSRLKPACGFTYAAINFDSFCDPKKFLTVDSIPIGYKPPSGFMGKSFDSGSRYPDVYSAYYDKQDVCSPTGCVTVGVIIGNGVDKTGKRPLCVDTQWYRNFACFPRIFPELEIIRPKENNGIYRICKGDSVILSTTINNKTYIEDLESAQWYLVTSNAGPGRNNIWSRLAEQSYYRCMPIKDSGTNKMYNYIVTQIWGDDPVLVGGTWVNGKFNKIGKADTTITAIISAWDTAAETLSANEAVFQQLYAKGLDIYGLDEVTLGKITWNGKGIFGDASTGSTGCLDTTGFGNLMRFYFKPKIGKIEIINSADTLLRPVRIVNNPGNPYGHAFKTKWNGVYLAELKLKSKRAKCKESDFKFIISGFQMKVDYPDTFVCRGAGNMVKVKPFYRYYAPGGLSSDIDSTDYWGNASRINDVKNGINLKNRERTTFWDWSKADNTSNPVTFNGTKPYGDTGLGNPWLYLGRGSGKYYMFDSGVYWWTNIATDSSGCSDTISLPLVVTRVDVNFGIKVVIAACNPTVEFSDSAVLHDPARWFAKYKKYGSDFITSWYIDWGDNENYTILRQLPTDAGLPSKIRHTYNRNGKFRVVYRVKTKEGCEDTFQRFINIPGPVPKFKFVETDSNIHTICPNTLVNFTNLSDSTRIGTYWKWRFGDGNSDSLINRKSVKNTYLNPGKYYVFLEQWDSLILPGGIVKFCKAIYPDTPNQKAMIVIVKPLYNSKLKIEKDTICPRQLNSFTNESDSILGSANWKFIHINSGTIETNTTLARNYKKGFSQTGKWMVVLNAGYNPWQKAPYCPVKPDTGYFYVYDLDLDFTIDLNSKPKYCYTISKGDGVEFWWGFKHGNNILNTLPNNFLENANTKDRTICTVYDKVGQYWVCVIGKNAIGCIDTVCKLVDVQYAVFIKLSNIFTPGKDGFNDEFVVPIMGEDNFELNIYNRYGARVFATKNARTSWNGKVDNIGSDCPEGMYYYELTWSFIFDEKVNTVKGGVYLKR